MKKHFLLPILAIAIITTVTYSCKKDSDTVSPVIEEEVTPTPSTSNLSSFFSQNVLNATQSFTINAGIGQSISGSQGTYIYIPANSFQDNGGNIVTGNIEVELIEIQTKADMILLNKTTTSNGQLLISGGEISIKAFQSGEQLTLSAGGSVSITMPTNNPTNMSLFSGTEDSFGNVNWDSTTTNVAVDSTSSFTFTIYDNTLGNDSLGWINCDYFYGGASLTTLNITIPVIHNNTNTSTFLFFSNIYSVAGTVWDGNVPHFHSYASSLPVGEQITIVAISEISGQLYSSFTPITLTANHTEAITFSATTTAALQTDLNNL